MDPRFVDAVEPRPAPPRRRHWHVADRIGATASLACAVHCAALPFVLALLPLLGLGFLAGDAFERGFVSFAAVLAGVALWHGYRGHRRRLPLAMAVPGLILLVAGICVDVHVAAAIHTLMVTTGGTLVAVGHLVNLRTSRGRAAALAARARGRTPAANMQWQRQRGGAAGAPGVS